MTFTTVTTTGDEETYSTIERAADEAHTIAARSAHYVDVVNEDTDAVVYVAVVS